MKNFYRLAIATNCKPILIATMKGNCRKQLTTSQAKDTLDTRKRAHMEEKKVSQQKKQALKGSSYQEKMERQLQRLIEEKTGLQVTTKTAVRMALLTAIASMKNQAKKTETKTEPKEKQLTFVYTERWSYCDNCSAWTMHRFYTQESVKKCLKCSFTKEFKKEELE